MHKLLEFNSRTVSEQGNHLVFYLDKSEGTQVAQKELCKGKASFLKTEEMHILFVVEENPFQKTK